MDAIKVILGLVLGLIMIIFIITTIGQAFGPWIIVVIAAIVLAIYLNRDK